MINPLIKFALDQPQNRLKINKIQPLKFVICPECDWISARQENNVLTLRCPHCAHTLKAGIKPKSTALIYAVCGFVLLVLSLFVPFLKMNIVGIVNKISLVDVLGLLYFEKEFGLDLILLCLVFLFPCILLLIQIFMLLPFFISQKIKRGLLVTYYQLKQWTLPEIFMAGVCVSFIKLTSYGDISIFKGFGIFCFFVFVFIKSVTTFPNRNLWNQVAPAYYLHKEVQINQTAMSQNIRLCQCCHAILNDVQKKCLRCGIYGEKRKAFSLQLTSAFLLSAVILYLPANILPVMQTLFLGASSGATILDGVMYMWEDKDYPVALIILCASILIPILKITGLSFLCYFCYHKKPRTIQTCRKWTKMYNMIEVIGKWSMIDVFVVIMLVSLIRYGRIVSVFPDLGIYFFASVVIITMIASKQFDSRLIWDRPLIRDPVTIKKLNKITNTQVA